MSSQNRGYAMRTGTTIGSFFIASAVAMTSFAGLVFADEPVEKTAISQKCDTAGNQLYANSTITFTSNGKETLTLREFLGKTSFGVHRDAHTYKPEERISIHSHPIVILPDRFQNVDEVHNVVIETCVRWAKLSFYPSYSFFDELVLDREYRSGVLFEKHESEKKGEPRIIHTEERGGVMVEMRAYTADPLQKQERERIIRQIIDAMMEEKPLRFYGTLERPWIGSGPRLFLSGDEIQELKKNGVRWYLEINKVEKVEPVQ